MAFYIRKFCEGSFCYSCSFEHYVCPYTINLNQHKSFEKDTQKSSKVMIA